MRILGLSDVYPNINNENREPTDLETIGNGVTIPCMEGMADIYINGKEWKNLNPLYYCEGSLVKDTAPFILMHELVGHAIPFVLRKASKTEPAAINENLCRKEIGETQREIQYKDVQFNIRKQ